MRNLFIIFIFLYIIKILLITIIIIELNRKHFEIKILNCVKDEIGMSLSIGNVIEFIQSMLKTSTTNEGGYGGGMAGAAFDPIGFIKKPQVILRLISLVS